MYIKLEKRELLLAPNAKFLKHARAVRGNKKFQKASKEKGELKALKCREKSRRWKCAKRECIE